MVHATGAAHGTASPLWLISLMHHVPVFSCAAWTSQDTLPSPPVCATLQKCFHAMQGPQIPLSSIATGFLSPIGYAPLSYPLWTGPGSRSQERKGEPRDSSGSNWRAKDGAAPRPQVWGCILTPYLPAAWECQLDYPALCNCSMSTWNLTSLNNLPASSIHPSFPDH